MASCYETLPCQKMPDDEELSGDYCVYLKMDFERNHYDWGCEYFGDLTKYYKWVEFQNIEKMEHNLIRLGCEGMDYSVDVIVMFTFPTIGDAVAFKLMWK